MVGDSGLYRGDGSSPREKELTRLVRKTLDELDLEGKEEEGLPEEDIDLFLEGDQCLLLGKNFDP